MFKLPVLLKYNRGNSLMSWEEINVPIFKNVFLFGGKYCFSGDGGLNFIIKK